MTVLAVCIGVVVFAVVLGFALAFIHGASIASGNHEDPFRDVGNGGYTLEDAIRDHGL